MIVALAEAKADAATAAAGRHPRTPTPHEQSTPLEGATSLDLITQHPSAHTDAPLDPDLAAAAGEDTQRLAAGSVCDVASAPLAARAEGDADADLDADLDAVCAAVDGGLGDPGFLAAAAAAAGARESGGDGGGVGRGRGGRGGGEEPGGDWWRAGEAPERGLVGGGEGGHGWWVAEVWGSGGRGGGPGGGNKSGCDRAGTLDRECRGGKLARLQKKGADEAVLRPCEGMAKAQLRI